MLILSSRITIFFRVIIFTICVICTIFLALKDHTKIGEWLLLGIIEIYTIYYINKLVDIKLDDGKFVLIGGLFRQKIYIDKADVIRFGRTLKFDPINHFILYKNKGKQRKRFFFKPVFMDEEQKSLFNKLVD